MNLCDYAQRPRYALAIIIGLCLAPFMYSKGWYLNSPPACPPCPPAVVQAAPGDAP